MHVCIHLKQFVFTYACSILRTASTLNSQPPSKCVLRELQIIRWNFYGKILGFFTSVTRSYFSFCCKISHGYIFSFSLFKSELSRYFFFLCLLLNIYIYLLHDYLFSTLTLSVSPSFFFFLFHFLSLFLSFYLFHD